MNAERVRLMTANTKILRGLVVCCLIAVPGNGRAQAAKLRMSEAEATRLLASDDLGERHRALGVVEELGDQTGPQLRAAVIRAAWELVRGETDLTPGSHAYGEYLGDYAYAVAGLRDPAAIPFLVEHAGQLNDDIADFGEMAFPAVLEQAEDARPLHRHQIRVWESIITLRYLVEDGSVSSEGLEQVREVVKTRLTEPGQDMLVIGSAGTLAVVLGDPELLASAERLARDSSAVVALLADYLKDDGPGEVAGAVSHVQEWLRDRLAGVPLPAGYVRRRAR